MNFNLKKKTKILVPILGQIRVPTKRQVLEKRQYAIYLEYVLYPKYVIRKCQIQKLWRWDSRNVHLLPKPTP